MNYLSVEDLSKSYGDRLLFSDVNFGISKGDKVALVARNGSGKTTLLNLLKGKNNPDTGNVVFRKDISVGFLEQIESFNGNSTIHEAIMSGEHPALKAITAYQKKLDENPEDIEKELDEMTRTDAWDFESRTNIILGKLGLHDRNLKIEKLSGGQKKRLSLAKILIDDPEFIILDEPTNHLDLDMIEWLESYLTKSHRTILLVTHDRYFLETICDTIIELDNQQMYSYKGNYSYYLEKKAERREIEMTNLEKAKNLYRKELQWIRRQPKARGTKQKARKEAFKDVKHNAKKVIKDDEMTFPIQMERLGTKILEFHNVGFSFPDLLVLKNFDYIFKKGEKIGIVGRNGVGKSTMLKLILNELPLEAGKIIQGETVKIGYYNQDGLKFKEGQKMIEVIRDVAEYIPLKGGRKLSAAQLLEKFLFPRDTHFQYVEKLSGGERRRLHLLKILMQNPNFLILDEPTNDLDIFTLGVLEDYLEQFEGCVLTVSHDRYFLDRISDHIFYFKGEGQIKDILGNYQSYRDQLKLEQQEANKKKAKEVKTEKPKQVEQAGKPKKLSYKDQRRLEQIEKELEQLENEKATLTESLYQGLSGQEASDNAQKLQQVVSKIEDLEMEWMELAG